MDALLEINALQHHFDDGKKISFPDLQLNKGEELLILGPSGCGKTTLLHLLAGILPIQSGEIIYNGKGLKGKNTSQLSVFRKENVGIIFQSPKFIRSLTIKENINAVKYFSGKNYSDEKVLLNELNISSLADTLPEKCSLGEQQRAAIACALINTPQIILADEPTSALDDRNCKAAIDLLKNVAKKRNSVLIIVTHDNRLMDLFSNKVILQ